MLTPLLLTLLAVTVLVAVWCRQIPGACARRHNRYRQAAGRVLARLPQLATDGARLNYLRKINPYVFEELLLLALARQGLEVVRNRSYSGDGGLDGQVFIGGRRWLIQAKRYSRAIVPGHVEEFGALLLREQCAGLFIHTGRTGKKSYDSLRRCPSVHLVSGQRLLRLLSGETDVIRLMRDGERS
ncbi:restriction endonuclease [Salmonella enterica subsp. enterica serovar Virchow]|nr:restriction endonuclease [Salmonella enterica subsp. enterica serovar Virchow]